MKRHAKAGDGGLLDGRRVSARKGKGQTDGRRGGTCSTLDPGQMPRSVENAVCFMDRAGGSGPDPSASGKILGLSTVQLYLKRWNFTPQKPLKRATQRSPEAIRRWL